MRVLAGSFPFTPAGNESMMSRSKSRPVALSPADRERLVKLVRTGSHPAQEARRARILLELDENDLGRGGPVPTQEVVAERAGVSVATVRNTAEAHAERGGDVTATIGRKKRLTPPVEPKVTGEVEARLIALACSQPPEGRARWSLRLLEKQVALMDDIPDLDHSTIGKALKRGRCGPI
jgi:transposase